MAIWLNKPSQVNLLKIIIYSLSTHIYKLITRYQGADLVWKPLSCQTLWIIDELIDILKNISRTFHFLNYHVQIIKYIIYRLEEITPLVSGVKSYIYTLPTKRNYVVSYWRKKSYIETLPTERNYTVSYWRKILHINTTDWKKLRC